jgi:hypothetical protein
MATTAVEQKMVSTIQQITLRVREIRERIEEKG